MSNEFLNGLRRFKTAALLGTGGLFTLLGLITLPNLLDDKQTEAEHAAKMKEGANTVLQILPHLIVESNTNTAKILTQGPVRQECEHLRLADAFIKVGVSILEKDNLNNKVGGTVSQKESDSIQNDIEKIRKTGENTIAAIAVCNRAFPLK
ncbi:MAG: hypothetical protein JWO78_2188 [Micavibrio sp.]|nr:hypothetical protein [Micavibrio sp.]